MEPEKKTALAVCNPFRTGMGPIKGIRVAELHRIWRQIRRRTDLELLAAPPLPSVPAISRRPARGWELPEALPAQRWPATTRPFE